MPAYENEILLQQSPPRVPFDREPGTHGTRSPALPICARPPLCALTTQRPLGTVPGSTTECARTERTERAERTHAPFSSASSPSTQHLAAAPAVPPAVPTSVPGQSQLPPRSTGPKPHIGHRIIHCSSPLPFLPSRPAQAPLGASAQHTDTAAKLLVLHSRYRVPHISSVTNDRPDRPFGRSLAASLAFFFPLPSQLLRPPRLFHTSPHS
ncbi:hypothetical protein A1Q1_02349 [Trichosporon asahii var. asahii CBS 2479]|uniref:Uncharacterized protein n=1 Tax=Trichosporon asahii var. asahii (strain ATCC 90039 / CBS 2479 / JCM 2466 / KCTC 7840 / NBRC 103889/ NCYC 2677 / UAMH 7654) TaxID=1186058 RepID=J6F0F9_TRIAS|nr:hypothetical protein A1Q1_02349 [Trichosporon asahii var. asahii CBS 2479]EJT48622.1 hypothetical protein A1Q1_02349 [Trichosporon asahii var. asahii CBS 2479]